MQEGQNRKTSSLSILAIAGVEPYQEKPGEEYMNEAQLSHFKRILEAWRNQLRDEVDRTVTHMQDEAANFPDPVDRAAQEEEFSLELRNRDRERKLIKKIEKTLKKSRRRRFRLLRILRCRNRYSSSGSPSNSRPVHRLQNAGRNPRKTDGRLIPVLS